MIVREDDQREERRYSNGEVNRELTPLKRIPNLARQNGKLMPGPHTTKNDEGRAFPFTDSLERLLEAEKAEHERLKADGVICRWVFNRSNRKVKGRGITTFIKAFRAACTKAGCPGRIPHDLRRTAVRTLVRAGIPDRVAMQMTGHKTRSVFERYNIVSECDLVEAAKKLKALATHSMRSPAEAGHYV